MEWTKEIPRVPGLYLFYEVYKAGLIDEDSMGIARLIDIGLPLSIEGEYAERNLDTFHNCWWFGPLDTQWEVLEKLLYLEKDF